MSTVTPGQCVSWCLSRVRAPRVRQGRGPACRRSGRSAGTIRSRQLRTSRISSREHVCQLCRGAVGELNIVVAATPRLETLRNSLEQSYRGAVGETFFENSSICDCLSVPPSHGRHCFRQFHHFRRRRRQESRDSPTTRDFVVSQ